MSKREINSGFFSVPLKAITDNRLTAKTLRVYLKILSCSECPRSEEGFVPFHFLSQDFFNEEEILTALKELKSSGYLDYEQASGDIVIYPIRKKSRVPSKKPFFFYVLKLFRDDKRYVFKLGFSSRLDSRIKEYQSIFSDVELVKTIKFKEKDSCLDLESKCRLYLKSSGTLVDGTREYFIESSLSGVLEIASEWETYECKK